MEPAPENINIIDTEPTPYNNININRVSVPEDSGIEVPRPISRDHILIDEEISFALIDQPE